MPQIFLTRDQRRGYLLKKAINDFLLKTGGTKESLMKTLRMTNGTFYRRLRNPGEFTLDELCLLFDVMNTPPEQRAEILK